jgi:chloramphenicol-sensitive protein RarD
LRGRSSLLALFLALTGQWRDSARGAQLATIGTYAIAAVLLSINWLIYVGRQLDFIVETSPATSSTALSVLLGVIFLRERLRQWQWVSVALAAAGVIYLTFVYGRLPWIALSLALTFGLYGLVKKIAPLNSLNGLTLETGILFPVAAAYLLVVGLNGTGGFTRHGPLVDILLIGAGLVTTIPLLLFASATKLAPLSVVGFLQYIASSMQFLIGVFVYREPFDSGRLIGFSMVWLALIIFAVESYSTNRIRNQAVAKLQTS